MKPTNLQINVFSYPDRKFLGQRNIPIVYTNETDFNISAEKINSQVDEVKNLHGKDEIFFKTNLT